MALVALLGIAHAAPAPNPATGRFERGQVANVLFLRRVVSGSWNCGGPTCPREDKQHP